MPHQSAHPLSPPGKPSPAALFIQWSGPLLLSLVPWLILHVFAHQAALARHARTVALWQEQARDRAESFRAGCTFTAQVDRMFFACKTRLQRQLVRTAGTTAPLTAADVATAFTKAFPPSHRHPEVRLYAVAIDGTGASQRLRGSGLSDENAALVAQVLGSLCRADQPGGPTRDRAEVRRSLDRRVAGLFDDTISFAHLAETRAGKLTLGRSSGVEVSFIWDRIMVAGRPALGLLAIFPAAAPARARSLAHALLGARSDRILPVLVPIEQADRRTRFLAPPGSLPRPLAETLAPLANLDTLRAHRFPHGQAITDAVPGHWLYRAPISANIGYELWLLSRAPAQPRWGTGNASTFALGLGLALGWSLMFLRRVTTGQYPAPSMRFWFLAYFLFVGAVPLTVLAVLGNEIIGTTLERRRGDAVESHLARLEELDGGARMVMARFANLCLQHTFTPQFVAPLLADGPAHEPAANTVLRQVFRTFRRFSLPLQQLIVIRMGRTNSIYTESGQVTDADRGVHQLLVPLAISSAQYLEPVRAASFGAALSNHERMLLKAFQFSSSQAAGNDFADLRYKGMLMEIAGQPAFQFHDLVATNGSMSACLVFRASALYAQRRYIEWMLNRLTPVVPHHRYALGHRIAGGYAPVWPRLGSDWRRPDTAALRAALALAARSGTRVVRHGRQSAVIALPCRRLADHLLGAQLSFATLNDEATRQRLVLAVVLIALATAGLLLGVTLSRHLFLPLQAVEDGLRSVALGDLSIRVGLARQDELGDLTRAFDRMIAGLQARRELGRFVSASLDAAVATAATAEATATEGAILVSDLRSFTTLSEQHPPAEVVAMLNRHLDTMSVAISGGGGRVEQFIGDAVVATFFADTPATAMGRAVRAGLAMVAAHQRNIAERQRRGSFAYRMGIGIDAGMLLMGSFGGRNRREHTVLGPARERAEQLESLSRNGKYTRLLVSSIVRDACPEHRFVPLAGTINTWELVDGPS